MRVAVVGATGQVGTVMRQLLRERDFPVDTVVGFASPASAGRRLSDGTAIAALSDEAIRGFDIALFSAGAAVARDWAPRFAAAGAVVIDNSSAFRMDQHVPLVVAEVNPEALDDHRGIVANPNCQTMQMVVALKPIHDHVGIRRVTVTTFQSVSGSGGAASRELEAQVHALAVGAAAPEPAVFAHQIAGNVLPHAGTFAEGEDHTSEERKMINETRKILADPHLRVSPTCTRVPVACGHSESVLLELGSPMSAEHARTILRAAPGVIVVDDVGSALYPTPLAAAGTDPVYVGRVRADPGRDGALAMWVVSDNLRKGAALNAVQVAELLLERKLVGRGSRPVEATPMVRADG